VVWWLPMQSWSAETA